MNILAIILSVAALVCCAITAVALRSMTKTQADFASLVVESFEAQNSLNEHQGVLNSKLLRLAGVNP